MQFFVQLKFNVFGCPQNYNFQNYEIIRWKECFGIFVYFSDDLHEHIYINYLKLVGVNCDLKSKVWPHQTFLELMMFFGTDTPHGILRRLVRNVYLILWWSYGILRAAGFTCSLDPRLFQADSKYSSFFIFWVCIENKLSFRA